MSAVSLDAPSRVLRVVTLAARARTMQPGDELTLGWPLAEGMPLGRRLAALLHEAELAVHDGNAPGAFTDEMLARDAERAGLHLVRREGCLVTLRREIDLPLQARERLVAWDALLCVALVLRADLLLRLERSPERLFARARRGGTDAALPITRAELRADLALLEPLVPGRRGCLRRVVAEVLGSSEAAREPVRLGLTPHATGHASFARSTPWAPQHPVVFELP